MAPGAWLNVARLAALWPKINEHGYDASRPRLASFLDAPCSATPLVGDGDALTSYILEHQIHARDLHLLGDFDRNGGEVRAPTGQMADVSAPTCRAGPWTYRLFTPWRPIARAPRRQYRRPRCGAPGSRRSALEQRAHPARRRDTLGQCRSRRSSSPERAPTRSIPTGRQFLEPICEASATPQGATDVERATLLSALLNLLGVALRRLGRLPDALRRFDQALAIAQPGALAGQQDILYNRGFTRLQGAMRRTARTGAHVDGVAVHLSSLTATNGSAPPGWRAARTSNRRSGWIPTTPSRARSSRSAANCWRSSTTLRDPAVSRALAPAGGATPPPARRSWL